MIYGRSFITAFITCAILVSVPQSALPSYNSEAGHKYAVASQRLADLRKSRTKKKYRSYWVDCIRTFEAVEKKYPKSPNAAEACFDRAGLYFELYQFNKYSRDLDASIQSYGKCQSAYPKHAKAPEGLYRALELSLDYKKNNAAAMKTYAKLAGTYPGSAWSVRARTRLGASVRNNKPEPEIRRMPGPEITSGKKTPAGVVKTIRHWSQGAYTRIVIDQNTPVKFLARELKNPDRLVFDLLHAHVDASLHKEPLVINNGILKQVRASQNTPDTVRVVLDLASIKSYAAFPLRDPNRLVIDVTGDEGRTAENGSTSAETSTLSEPGDAGQQKTDSQAESGPTASVHPKTGLNAPVVPPVQRPAVNNDNERLTLSRQLGLKVRTIAIDAGHGGHDPGAIGGGGLKEKNVTLDIAKRLAVLVKDRLGCKVVMTRDRDVFIPLDRRPFIAKASNADLFVSIHINSNRKRKARGIETYVQGLKASDREAMATAARENAMSTKSLSELNSDVEVDRMLRDLRSDNKIEESIDLAGNVQNSLVGSIKPMRKQVVNLGIKRAFFYVLMNTNIPSILAEVGFISNPDEEKLLKKDSYRQSIAEALYRGIKNYIDSRSPHMMGT